MIFLFWFLFNRRIPDALNKFPMTVYSIYLIQFGDLLSFFFTNMPKNKKKTITNNKNKKRIIQQTKRNILLICIVFVFVLILFPHSTTTQQQQLTVGKRGYRLFRFSFYLGAI